MRKNKNRFIYMVLAGILISLLLHALVPFPEKDHNRIYDFLISIIITIFVWEGNLRIDHYLNEKIPWLNQPVKRILIHLPAGLFFSFLAIYIPMLIYDDLICTISAVNRTTLMVSCIVLGLMITVILLSIEISTQFFIHWKNSLIEVERYKNESTQAQLQNLKNQINPHFLFNNMSVLSSLVYKDQDKAVDFINQLSKVYRYILDSKNNELVTLEEELKFIKSYTFLLQIRFDKNIVFTFDIPESSQKRLMPPMALQLLVENTIKHNEVSNELPLHVSITANDTELSVINTLQLRTVTEPSSQTGIENIKERYKFYTDQPVVVSKTENKFMVKIPLLHTK